MSKGAGWGSSPCTHSTHREALHPGHGHPQSHDLHMLGQADGEAPLPGGFGCRWDGSLTSPLQQP